MAMNAANLIMRLENDLRVPNPKWTPGSWKSVQTWLDQDLQPDLRALAKQSDAIQRDLKLSEEGKRAQLRTLGGDFLPRFKWVQGERDTLDRRVAQNETVLFAVESPVKNEVLRFFRGQEIRNDWLDASVHERDAAFARACEQNDQETMAAFLDKPGQPMVSEEMKARALTERARRAYGEPGGLVETHEQNQLLADYLDSWRDMLGATFRDLGVPVATIGETLGGTRQSTTGLPDGSPPLQGNTWRQTVAAAGV